LYNFEETTGITVAPTRGKEITREVI
jgi:hypothetical protein